MEAEGVGIPSLIDSAHVIHFVDVREKLASGLFGIQKLFFMAPRVKRIRRVSTKVLKHLRIRRWDFGPLQFNACILSLALAHLQPIAPNPWGNTRYPSCSCAILSLFGRRFCLYFDSPIALDTGLLGMEVRYSGRFARCAAAGADRPLGTGTHFSDTALSWSVC